MVFKPRMMPALAFNLAVHALIASLKIPPRYLYLGAHLMVPKNSSKDDICDIFAFCCASLQDRMLLLEQLIFIPATSEMKRIKFTIYMRRLPIQYSTIDKADFLEQFRQITSFHLDDWFSHDNLLSLIQ